MAQYIVTIGDTFTTELTITDINGDAVDLTDGTAVLTMYDRNGDVYHTETVTSHTTPLSGITTITISKTDTAGFVIGNFPYQIDVTLADTSGWRVEDGFIEVDA